MNALLYLITAHFLADFPLQPGWLVAYKKKHAIGAVIHGIVHFAVIILLTFPLWHVDGLWWAIRVIFVTHVLIDLTKIQLEKKHPHWRFPLYVADQISHLIIIYGAYCWLVKDATPKFPEGWVSYYSDPSVISFVLILALVTYFYDISRHFFLTRKTLKPYTRNYRMMGRNALIVVIAFGVYWLTR